MADPTIDMPAHQEEAYSLHKAGRFAEAQAIYKTILKSKAENADVLGLLAMAQYQLNDVNLAIESWRASLSCPADAMIQIRNANNYLTAILKQPASDSKQVIPDFQVPPWPKAIAPDAGQKNMVLSLARGLEKLGRQRAALDFLESAMELVKHDIEFFRKSLRIILEAGYPERAEIHLKTVDASWKTDGELLLLQAALANITGRSEECLALAERAMHALPVLATGKFPTQKYLLCILSRAPKRVLEPIGSPEFHFTENSPAGLAKNFTDQYRFMSVFPEAATARDALAGYPSPDIVINNWVNAELLSTPDRLSFISNFADGLGRPVLNHPREAAKTTRQRNAALLAGIPNLLVPPIVRFINRSGDRAAIIRLVEGDIGFPAIIRDPFQQMGKEATRIGTRKELEDLLKALPQIELYAIQYVHNPVSQDVFRKIRAAVVGKTIFISHVQLGEQWNVHRDRRELVTGRPGFTGSVTGFADRIVDDPVATLGKPAMLALGEIRKRIPLDLYGIDFDLMPDGRLLFFEANAAMNISFRGRYGHQEVRARMHTALDQMFSETTASFKPDRGL